MYSGRVVLILNNYVVLRVNSGKFNHYNWSNVNAIFLWLNIHHFKWQAKLAKKVPLLKISVIQYNHGTTECRKNEDIITVWLCCGSYHFSFAVMHVCIPELVGGISSKAGEACVQQHETQEKYHLGTCGGLTGWCVDETCLDENFVDGGGWCGVDCWSMSSSTVCASSSRSCWCSQSMSDPMTILMGFSKPSLGVTMPEEMRFLITLSSRFLRTVFPARGRPVNNNLTDLCLIFCWWRYFSSKFSSSIPVSVYMHTNSMKPVSVWSQKFLPSWSVSTVSPLFSWVAGNCSKTDTVVIFKQAHSSGTALVI